FDCTRQQTPTSSSSQAIHRAARIIAARLMIFISILLDTRQQRSGYLSLDVWPAPFTRPARAGAGQGTPSVHQIVGDELRALRRVQREQEPKSPFVVISERRAR